MGVILYVTLPPAGTPGRGNQPFQNGPVLAIHSVLGVLLVIAVIYLLVIAIIVRDVPVIVTSAVGLVAIVTAAVMGFSFVRNVATGTSMGWPRPPRSPWPAMPSGCSPRLHAAERHNPGREPRHRAMRSRHA